ncbi:MAG: L,D-transpeptidase, partial [Akkermansiaceae bacterium]|nr:L,D-transpeptidase [Akkermansiaceae bacterium]
SVWKNEELLSQTNPSNSHIVVSLEKQRAFLMNNEEVAMDYPICSGTKSRPTPKGTFHVLEKIVDKSSNRYGKILDASGNVVNSDADSTQDNIPAGGKFKGAPMRYWMRLTNDGVGHHIGPVKRYPASHACIRGPSAVMPLVYSKMKVGSQIKVE